MNPGDFADLDKVDHAILRALMEDARISNKALSEKVGVAPSTCLARVRVLRKRGAISGFSVRVHPAVFGHELQAFIAVQLAPAARKHLGAFTQQFQSVPGVIAVYFVAGNDDFLLHVAVRNTDELRNFVVQHISSRGDIANTKTSIIFEQWHANLNP